MHRSLSLVGIVLVLSAGCAIETSVPAPLQDITIDVCRITQLGDLLQLEQFELFGKEPEVISFVRLRFRVRSPENLAGNEIQLRIIAGTEDCLFEQECFAVRVPVYVAEGKDAATWVDAQGRQQSSSIFPMDGRSIVEKRANKPVETTSVTRPEIRESCSFSVALRSVSHG